jgi:hypothetical protein
MAERDRTGRTIVLVGGAGIVAWWLLSRGKGWGFRSPGDGHGKETDTAQRPARCIVWIRADRIEIDGVAADLPTVVAKGRQVGTAEVHATGDAITGAVINVLKALQAAGVKLYVTPDLAYIVPSEPL